MSLLPELGESLRLARKKRFPKDNMHSFSLRIGVSRATYQKMEKGDMTVSFQHYYEAAKLLGTQKQFGQIFEIEGSLFDD